MRNGVVADEVDALEVDIDDLVPFGFGRRLDRAVALDAGIVRDDVDPPPGVDYVGDAAGDVGADRYVGDDRPRLESAGDEVAGNLLRRNLVAVDHGDLRAAFGQQRGDCRADPHRAAGDDRHLAGELLAAVAHARPALSAVASFAWMTAMTSSRWSRIRRRASAASRAFSAAKISLC